MNERIDWVLHHMAKSHRELARILKAERDLACHAAGLVINIPHAHLAGAGVDSVKSQSHDLSKNIAVYLNGLADLEEALAENLEPVVKELQGQEEE
jgi:hypothetical protein